MTSNSSTVAAKQDVILFTLSTLGVIWYIVLWSIGLVGWRTARKRYLQRPRSPLASATSSAVPGVSILRPLKGLDTNLYENLESTFTQEYPNYEVLLSVADENDQALPIVRDLTLKYPSVNAKVIIGDEAVGVNPKVNNLVRSYRQAANDILWVLDSNIAVDRGTLARSVDALLSTTSSGKRIAVVHHVPFAFANEHTAGSLIEAAFLNTNHAKMYLAINTVAIESCVVGKSNLYRRSDLERVNGTLKPIPSADEGARQAGACGLPIFGRFLAEDNMIASALWHELGVRHDLSCDIARNAVGNMTLSDYIWRRVRWIRVRKHMVLVATLIEPITECVVLSIIGAASLKYIFRLPAWILLSLHYTAWLAVDIDVYTSLAGHPPPGPCKFFGAWVARELLALPIWFLAIFGSEVEWRGRRYQVLRNGEVKRADKNSGIFGWFQRRRKNNAYQPLDSENMG